MGKNQDSGINIPDPPHCMKETLRRRITVTASFNEVSTDQMGNRLAVRGGEMLLCPHLSTNMLQDRDLKTT